MSLGEIKSIDNGTKFYRVDLHIHSYGEYASHDVTDRSMTPKNIIDEAIKENIKVISLTDHNEIGNIPSALEYAKGKDILVIPGVELSTSQGHLLVYFELYEDIRSFIGELPISKDKKQCDCTITHALNIAKKYNGFGVAAHIDLKSGFELYLSGYTPFKQEILKHDLLLGLEISKKKSVNWYTENDDNSDRVRFFRGRKTALGEDNSYNIAKIMSSDAHSITALGKNFSGNKKLTKLKLDSLDFNSVRIAFLNPNSRVRIEEELPNNFPKFLGISFEGGILDRQKIHFNNNFNCLIGGRGTGKSTTLECLRIGCGHHSNNEIIDSEAWPETIKIYYQDQSGQIIEFQRQKFGKVLNLTDTLNGIQQVTIEGFGQGETAELIRKCGKEPEALLNFIDNFLELGALQFENESLRTSLLQNQTILEKLKLEVDVIPNIEKVLNNAKRQLGTLKTNKAKEIVELEEGVANERTLRANLLKNIEEHISSINEGLNTNDLDKTIKSIAVEQIIVGKKEFEVVNQF